MKQKIFNRYIMNILGKPTRSNMGRKIERAVKKDIDKVKKVGKSILRNVYDNKGKILKKVVKVGGQVAAAKLKKMVMKKVKNAVVKGKAKIKKMKKML
jgi:hypothetical protein